MFVVKISKGLDFDILMEVNVFCGLMLDFI